MFTSATLPRETLAAIELIFGFDESHYVVFRQSTDRPNISLIVRKMLCALNLFADLAFVLGELDTPINSTEMVWFSSWVYEDMVTYGFTEAYGKCIVDIDEIFR